MRKRTFTSKKLADIEGMEPLDHASMAWDTLLDIKEILIEVEKDQVDIDCIRKKAQRSRTRMTAVCHELQTIREEAE